MLILSVQEIDFSEIFDFSGFLSALIPRKYNQLKIFNFVVWSVLTEHGSIDVSAKERFEEEEKKVPCCIVKATFSLSENLRKYQRSSANRVNVRELRLCANST
jgi:putative Ca2+/H+ antiporter (TMEM165/GDT1 family)